MDASGKILFVCPGCGYRAKIPGNYLGMSIRCPGCSTAQTVQTPVEKSESTGKTVSITRVATTPLPFTMDEAKQPHAAFAAGSAAKLATAAAPPGREAQPPPATQPAGGASPTLVFVCSACSFRARIPLIYAGKSIFCPKCNVTQVAPQAPAPPASGGTVVLQRVNTATTPAKGTPVLAPAPPSAPAPAPQLEISDKVLFTCAACNMRARIPAKYAGTTIKCPKCGVPGAVPLSEAMEEATGRTISVSRVDLAKGPATPPSKRPSGEFGSGPQPLLAPSQRPGGESVVPPVAKKDELGLEIDVSPSAETETLPPSGNPVAKQTGKGKDEDLLDLGPVTPIPQARKGGVVKRRGSSLNNLAATTSDKPAARAEPSPRKESDSSAANPPSEARSERPMAETESSVAGGPGNRARKAAAREDGEDQDADALTRRPDSPGMIKTHGMLIAGLALLVILLAACGVLYMKLESTESRLDALSESESASKAENDKLHKDMDDLNQQLHDQKVALDQAKSDADEAKSGLDKAQMDLTAAKMQDTQKFEDYKHDAEQAAADAKKAADDKDAKITELTQKLEDAQKHH